jgi:dTDP-4-amino-4,6-dideoxygalactose transaminase
LEIRKVPFQALGGLFEQDDVDAATKVLQAVADGGSFFPLPEEGDFQNALAKHEGSQSAVAVNSCGTALDLCIMALGIGKGDEVIVPGQTFICTATCASAQGAKVVFADVDPDTMCLDPVKVEAKITDKTKAIIPVHFAGLACDIDGFDALSKKYNIPIIYDAAHAVGTKYKGQPIGGAGLASCYSFQSNKNMTTIGEGGAITTNDTEFSEKVRQMKTFGYVYGGPSLRVVNVGFNYRMTKPQAAVGLTQLAKMDRVMKMRQDNFVKMNELIADVAEVKVPVNIDAGHACHIHVIQLDIDNLYCDRDQFKKALMDDFQIGTGNHYPAVWNWEVAEKFEYDNSHCEITEKVCKSVLTLPIFPKTTYEDMEYIAWAIKELIKKRTLAS